MSFLSLLSTGRMQSPLAAPGASGLLSQSAPPVFANARTNGTQAGMPFNPSSLMMMLLVTLLQELFSQMMGITPDAPVLPPAPDNNTDTGYDTEPEPPYTPPADPNYPPPPPPPPPPVYPPENRILGSAGLFGDPKFGVFSPDLEPIPTALKAFESHIKPGETVTLLNDTDVGGLKVSGTAVQVDPNNTNSSGIGTATFKSGNDTISIHGNGDLMVNGQKKGNINDNGVISPIRLANGVTVSTGQEIDGANGAKAERFVISNGEYKITAAPRKPHAESTPYLDMNFEELKPDAADNATGYQTTIAGIANPLGIADLLRLEPGDLQAIA